MSRKDKILRKCKQNPKNIRFFEIERLLSEYGFYLERSSGSHHIFTDDRKAITIPAHNKKQFILEVYVKKILKIIGEENE